MAKTNMLIDYFFIGMIKKNIAVIGRKHRSVCFKSLNDFSKYYNDLLSE